MKLVILAAMVLLSATTVGYECCQDLGTCSGGGGGSVPTPTPNSDWTGGLDPYTGPVPEDIQAITGEDTWLGVFQWMQQQEQAAGVMGSVSGTVKVELSAEGTPIVSFEPEPGMPEPPRKPPEGFEP